MAVVKERVSYPLPLLGILRRQIHDDAYPRKQGCVVRGGSNTHLGRAARCPPLLVLQHNHAWTTSVEVAFSFTHMARHITIPRWAKAQQCLGPRSAQAVDPCSSDLRRPVCRNFHTESQPLTPIADHHTQIAASCRTDHVRNPHSASRIHMHQGDLLTIPPGTLLL